MELKKYQKSVLRDLVDYTSYYYNSGFNPSVAFKEFWKSKGVETGQPKFNNYVDKIRGVPNVTLKVPTGGGKTYIACGAIKKILDFGLSKAQAKVVVWLVPSDPILKQTLKHLQNPEYPYRQLLDRDFNHRVNVYSKEDALNAINLSVSTIKENISIFVFSYSSFKDTKDGRKSRKENSAFVEFKNMFQSSGYILHNAEEYSLLQTINYFNPLVIIDESHNATSELSVGMIEDFNPSYIVDLTATPRDESNIISMVDAKALKKAEMIKLPLLVYNRYDKDEVLATAIDLQEKLEKVALLNQEKTGRYIRPIVLFQAQEKGEGNITYSEVKKLLLEKNIPENQIKIKVSDLDEISNLDLLSNECPVRFIITVNALKEGWDCPFAYILASIANRSSSFDVEHIIGRVLRLPYTKSNKDYPLLNSSYVITSSSNFYATASSISDGLKKTGYSDNDYRIITPKEIIETVKENIEPEELEGLFGNEIATWSPLEPSEDTQNTVAINPDSINSLGSDITNVINTKEIYTHGTDATDIIETAVTETNKFEKIVQQQTNDELSEEVKKLMKISKIKPGYIDDVKNIRIPQFYMKSNMISIFSEESEKLLTKEMLDEGYSLTHASLPKNLTEINNNVFVYDIDEHSLSSELSRSTINLHYSDWNKLLAMYGDTQKKTIVTQKIASLLDKKFDCIDTSSLLRYLNILFEPFTVDELDHVIENTQVVVEKIKRHIQADIERCRVEKFKELLDKNQIYIKVDSFTLLPEINSIDTSNKIAKSLYESEPNMNREEEKAISNIASLENVLFWHHIRQKAPGEFYINGYIHHYPDFVIYTKKGNVILVEFKGEDRKNEDSKLKVKLGKKWSDLSGIEYSYFMVFLDEAFKEDGAYNLSDCMDILKNL